MKDHLPLWAVKLISPDRQRSALKPCNPRTSKHDLAKLLVRLHPPVSRSRPKLAMSLIQRAGLDLYLISRDEPQRMSFSSFMDACHWEAWLETQMLLTRLTATHLRSGPHSSTQGGG